MDVVVVGELNADLVLTGLTSLPAYGEVRLAKDMRFALGSSSAILACNLARLGVEVGFVGKLGADETGNFLLRSLRDRGVETSQIIQSSAGRTGICVVMSFPHEYAMASYAEFERLFASTTSTSTTSELRSTCTCPVSICSPPCGRGVKSCSAWRKRQG